MPNGLSTMWFYLTDDADEAERVYRQRLFPHIDRSEAVLRDRLPVGPARAFAEKLTAYREAGVQRVFIWPLADEVNQLERFWETVVPLLER